MKKKYDEGFTLVELLISIVILAAIVIPTCASLTLSFRMNAKTNDMMQAQLAVSSTVETLMAKGMDADRIKTIIEKTESGAEIVYDFAWDTEKNQFSETDDYPGVVIKITEDKSTEGYFSLTVSDDDGLVTVITQVRAKGGA